MPLRTAPRLRTGGWFPMVLAKRSAAVALSSSTRRFAPLATVLYAVVAAVAFERGRDTGALWAGLAALGAGILALRRSSGLGRAVGWGLAMAIASLGVPSGASRLLDACAATGVLASAVGACVAMARLPSGDRLTALGAGSAAPTIGALVVAWSAAIVSSVGAPGGRLVWLTHHPRAWTWAALLVTVVALVARAERTRKRGRLELGVPERMLAARMLLSIELAGAVLVAAFVAGPPEGVARVSLALAACVTAGAALHPDAIAVARTARRAVGLALVGGSIALIGAVAVEGRAAGAWAITLATALACLWWGAASSRIELFFQPSRGAWLEAFDAAKVKALHADPRQAVQGALLALRAPLAVAGPSPELWTFAPSRAAWVDAAGYAHERDAELPETLVPIALAEPYGALRAEALEALEVRRAELRPLCSWMKDRGAILAMIVACEDEVEGVLVLPRGPRREPLTLEEIVAAKAVADRVAFACRARGTELRLLARAQESIRAAAKSEDRADRLEHDRDLDAHRSILATERLARPATVGIYATESRMALEALERRTRGGAPIAVVAAAGVDAVPYLARAHLAGSRARGPFVLVEGASPREHDLARWTDPLRSPLALSDRGLLVLLDVGALPVDVQRLVAQACAESRAPWARPDRLDVQLALTSACELGDLAASGRLDPALEVRLADAAAEPVTLPRLLERPEDFRAILTDRLAREGLRVRGLPVGIAPAAYARLAEYAFPGDDAELTSMVQRLVAECKTDTVCVADLDALCLPPPNFQGSERTDSSLRKDPLSA
ncbi:MAG TPA: hypothetical protein VEK07_25640 [Polyangiaceae bacterium]|nr:hypothetical protein [Polyangiaceae bacterium]